jgi:hypothetical protein
MDHEYTTMIEGFIWEGIEDGSFSPGSHPRIATMTLVGALNWLTRWWDPEGALTPADVADAIADSVLAGILTRQSPKIGAKDARKNQESGVGKSNRSTTRRKS